MLNTVNLEDYCDLVVSRTDPNNKGTWIWTPAFKQAISDLSVVGGGVLEIPVGFGVKLDECLISYKPILIKSAVRADISDNTNGNPFIPSNGSTIVWVGPKTEGYMYEIRPLNTGDVVWGGGSVDVEWNGNNGLIAGGVHLNNTKFSVFKGKVREVSYTGVMVSSDYGSPGNFSQLNNIDLEFVYGYTDDCQWANGLTIRGNGSTVPTTQQQLGTITGLVKNGFLVDIAETDNCICNFISAAVVGSGGGVKLRNIGFGPAASNLFIKVAGRIDSDEGLIGNRILHYVSEGGGITGTGEWSGTLYDYVNGRVFESHTYKMRDKIPISSGSVVGSQWITTAAFGLQWMSPVMPKWRNSSLTATLPPQYDLSDGYIEGVEVVLGSNDSSMGDVKLELKLSCMGSGMAPIIPDLDIIYPFTAPNQYFSKTCHFIFTTPVPYPKNGMIYFSLQRYGFDDADTHVGDVFFLGANLKYRSKGPNSIGSGSYHVPPWE